MMRAMGMPNARRSRLPSHAIASRGKSTASTAMAGLMRLPFRSSRLSISSQRGRGRVSSIACRVLQSYTQRCIQRLVRFNALLAVMSLRPPDTYLCRTLDTNVW